MKGWVCKGGCRHGLQHKSKLAAGRYVEQVRCNPAATSTSTPRGATREQELTGCCGTQG